VHPSPHHREHAARVDAVFSALSDPTRRRMMETMSHGEPVTATALAGALPISRQAVAKHLAVLREARLARAERAGRETRYSLETRPLVEAARWIQTVGGEWDRHLRALKRSLERWGAES
jgi:DNA-binding transcriptional ArsR family regulator